MTPQETREVLTRFYDALSRRDGETMASLYSKDAAFEDEVYELQGEDVGKMWRGLMSKAKTLTVSYTIAKAGSGSGTVEWTARYDFPGGGPVVNVILSELELENGKIVRQRDRFDFRRWAAQALGTKGRLLGRFEWFRRAVSRTAANRVGVPPKR
ncbi:MAG: nuclear transport factor 2 family protein [Acidobacteriota bacterium]|nr:nuclear transport factor 2 family protein [Acidobacteriota bacterium]